MIVRQDMADLARIGLHHPAAASAPPIGNGLSAVQAEAPVTCLLPPPGEASRDHGQAETGHSHLQSTGMMV